MTNCCSYSVHLKLQFVPTGSLTPRPPVSDPMHVIVQRMNGGSEGLVCWIKLFLCKKPQDYLYIQQMLRTNRYKGLYMAVR